MLYDVATKSNKLSPFSGIWNWIVGKLTNAVISNLQTNNKTVLGAINELNSNSFFTVESVPESNDLNDCRIKGSNKIHKWSMPNGSKNSPTDGADTRVFYIASSNYLDTYGTQIVLAPYRDNIWIRRYSTDGSWDEWKTI